MRIWEDITIERDKTVVVIGPNGSGKTQYGIKLAQLNNADHIGALRNIALTDNLPMMTYSQAEQEVNNRLNRKKSHYWELSNEIDLLFSKLMADDAASATRFRNLSFAGQNPPIERTKIMELSQLWESLFPSRQIKFEGYVPKVKSEYMGGKDYAASHMSDGERVSLYLAARVLDSNSDIIVIDEPEVHFHSKLAVTFWDALEKMRPNKKFVYITHNLEFALSRKLPIFLVVKPNQKPLIIEKASEIPTETSIDLLAAASLSIFAKRVIFCEGIADKSRDNMLLSAWFNTNNTVIVPLSSCKNVIEAVLSYKKTDIIQNLDVVGIIDQDYSSVGSLESVKNDVFVLPFHEIESLLLHEDLITEALKAIGRNQEDIKAIIKDIKESAEKIYSKEIINKVISERFKNEVEFTLKYRIRGLKSTTEDSKQRAEHIDIINELAKVAEQAYDNSTNEVIKAHEKGYNEILRILPGKPLLSLLLKHAGMNIDAYLSLICKLINDNNETVIKTLTGLLPARN